MNARLISSRLVLVLAASAALASAPGCRETVAGFEGGTGDGGVDAPELPDTPAFTESGITRSDLAIDRVVPNHGSFMGGNVAILRGAGFTGDANVSFGTHAVQPADHTLIDPRRLQVVVPAGEVGITDVTITVGDATFTLPDAYTYDALSVDPTSGAISGNTFVTILGSGTAFVPGDRVLLGRSECTDVEVLSPNRITCRTPPMAAGTVDVTVVRASDDSETVAVDAFSYYDSSDPNGGGLGGGPIRGALNLSVVDWNSGMPVADAFAIIGEDMTTEHQGFTDGIGQITFSGADLMGNLTIHVSKDCYERSSVVSFDAQDVTIFLLPLMDPRCGMGSPPGGGRGRNGAFIEGQLVWLGPEEYAPNPWGNMPMPRAGWERVAYVYTTQAETDQINPDPASGGGIQRITEVAPEGAGFVGYPYRIFARPAGLAVYALAGLENTTTREFVPYVMGVARSVLAGPGETVTDVNILMNIPLDHEVTTSPGALPPGLADGPDRFRFQAYVDLGGEGILVRNVNGIDFDTVRRRDAASVVRFVGEPALLGSLEDARYRLTAGWFTFADNNPPYSIVVMNGVTAVDDVVEMPDFLGIPDAVSPVNGQRVPEDRVLRWTEEGGPPADLHVVLVVGGDGMPAWRMFVRGDTFEAPIPDLSSIPGVPDVAGGNLYWVVYAVRIPSFNFDEFRYTYLNDRYWSQASYNFFTATL